MYETKSSVLSIGDHIRLRKTDKTRSHFANKEYRVASIEACVFLKNEKQETLKLNTHDLRDAHWDYAYTITGYGVQGASKPYIIDYELSYRKNLTHQRSFYIAISRAEQHVMIYTDDKVKLLDRLQNNTGQKYSAHDVIKAVNWSDPSDANLKEKMALLNEKTEITLLQESRKLKCITKFLSKEEVRHLESSINLEKQSGALAIKKEMTTENVNRELADVEREIY